MQHSSEKDEFHIKKSIGYCVLKPHAISAFLLTSLEERVVWGCCYMSIVISFVAMVAKDLDTPFWTSTWHIAFLELVSIQALVLPNFLVNTQHFHILIFSSIDPVIWNSSIMLCIDFTKQYLCGFFSFTNYATVFFSHALFTCCLWLITSYLLHISCSSSDNRKTTEVESFKKADHFFSYAQKHN
jgi:hypothetical protein